LPVGAIEFERAEVQGVGGVCHRIAGVLPCAAAGKPERRFSAIAHEMLMPFMADRGRVRRIDPTGDPIMNDTTLRPKPLLNGWRIAGWGSLLAVLLLPAFAMQFTSEVNWTASDFVFAAILLGLVGGVVELAARFARPGTARAGYILGGFTAFLTFWTNAAVGFIGDDDGVNVMFFLMVLAGLVAGAAARFRPRVMRWIAVLIAAGQYAVGIAALWMMPGHAVEWGVLTFFALLWSVCGWCFHRAAIKAG
jgi:hypothetical protein